ncbi:MAG: lipoyl(octanoyl) transferase LipB [Gammaproteobacteria bacterium]|nr:lipoyl(octanoyl) transferase LipB [Gammaproteobacteria bacterium]
MLADDPVTRRLGRRDYLPTWEAMQAFTDRRDADTSDEIWLVEHPPVFTQGMNGRPEHLLDPGDIPVVQVDRGGQVTYHGPGQLVVYPLLDLRRRQLGIRDLVQRLEFAVIDLLAGYGIDAVGRRDAPGVYVAGRKIASLGLRVRRSCSYHGLSLNVDLDPAPFARINPCGHAGLEVTRTADLGGPSDWDEAATALLPHLLRQLARPTAPPPRRQTPA